jgi:hypothetical protein
MCVEKRPWVREEGGRGEAEGRSGRGIKKTTGKRRRDGGEEEDARRAVTTLSAGRAESLSDDFWALFAEAEGGASERAWQQQRHAAEDKNGKRRGNDGRSASAKPHRGTAVAGTGRSSGRNWRRSEGAAERAKELRRPADQWKPPAGRPKAVRPGSCRGKGAQLPLRCRITGGPHSPPADTLAASTAPSRSRVPFNLTLQTRAGRVWLLNQTQLKQSIHARHDDDDPPVVLRLRFRQWTLPATGGGSSKHTAAASDVTAHNHWPFSPRAPAPKTTAQTASPTVGRNVRR